MQKGFSLIELLIVLAIIGVLTSISYPMYRKHVVKARRIKAEVALTDLAGRMEQYYQDKHTYKGATVSALKAKQPKDYTLTIAQATSTDYLLQAVPQTNFDPTCGTLSLNHLGEKSSSGSGKINECWP